MGLASTGAPDPTGAPSRRSWSFVVPSLKLFMLLILSVRLGIEQPLALTLKHLLEESSVYLHQNNSSTGALVKSYFNLVNASSCSSFQCHAISLLSSILKSLAIYDRFGMNFQTYPIIPRNLCADCLLVGGCFNV